jgi:PAS domain S-box-containing protein
MFAFAAYLFLLWAKKRVRRADLVLALLFIAMGFYDIFVSRVYAIPRAQDAIHWLRLVSAAEDVIAIIFLWYLSEYTGLVSVLALAVCVSFFCMLAAAEILAPPDLVWLASKPLLFSVKLPFLPEIPFSLFSSGPLVTIGEIAGLLYFIYCVIIDRRYASLGRRSEARGHAWVLAAIFLAILNDSLVSRGVYRFLLLTEYAWAASLIALTSRSIDEILAGAAVTERLEKSEARLRAMVEHVPFNIWMCDVDGRLIMQNAADIATVGKHLGEHYEEWTTPNAGLPLFAQMSRRALSGEAVDQNVSYEVDGEMRIFRDIIVPAFSGSAIIGSVGVGIDISEQMRAKGELEARLAEKEVLLREIHHRVKNNLQVVASLVNLRADSLEDHRAKEVFIAVQSQVDAIARVHESLYRSDNLATIDFGDYLQKLVGELFAMRSNGRIETVFDIESLALDIDAAIPCALIANELVTNSLKHAFQGRRSGRLAISLRRLDADFVVLAVEDDGEGIPEKIATAGGSSIGMVLVSSLASQLHGTLSIGGPRRNRVELRFPA